MNQSLSRKDKILSSIREAKEAYRIANETRDAMSSALTEVMRKLIRPGDIINLTYDQKKEWDWWLVNVKTVRGNDRGVRRFRIESEVAVSADPHSYALSTWSCEAVPINENGKSLSGRTHGVSKNTVRLSGSIIPMAPVNLEGSEFDNWEHDRLVEIICKAEMV